MDKDARNIIETNLDTFLKHPKETEMTIRSSLIKQGIEPNLETVLAFLNGLMVGILRGYYIIKVKRSPTPDEEMEYYEVLKRRAMELRSAFIETRINHEE
jgi:hypothetical protein